MNEQILFDRLRYLDRLKEAGISDAHARAHADAMDLAMRESVATKHDLVLVRHDLDSFRTALESKIEIAVRDLTIRLGGLIAAGVGILAAIKFFGGAG